MWHWDTFQPKQFKKQSSLWQRSSRVQVNKIMQKLRKKTLRKHLKGLAKKSVPKSSGSSVITKRPLFDFAQMKSLFHQFKTSIYSKKCCLQLLSKRKQVRKWEQNPVRQLWPIRLVQQKLRIKAWCTEWHSSSSTYVGDIGEKKPWSWCSKTFYELMLDTTRQVFVCSWLFS